MKKKLLLLFMVVISSLSVVQLNAQCTNNTTAYWTHTASNTLNAVDALATCHYLSEYSTINGLNVGGLYEFTMTNGGGVGNAYITVMTGPGGTGTVVAHGVSPLTVVATAATLYPHWNVDAACNTTTFCEVGTMTYLAPPSSCIQPISLSASNITTTTALLSWGDANTTPAPNYDVYNVLTTAPGPTNATVPTASSTTDTTTLTGLMPSTTYDYYVRARCSATDTSAWSGPFTYTTLANCLAPTTLGATTTSTSATMTWTDPNATPANNYDIVLGLTGTLPNPNTTTVTPVVSGHTSTSYMFPGLPSNTCFDYYVRSNCSATDSSTYTGPYTFCTAIAPLSCPAGSAPGQILYEGFDMATANTTIITTQVPGWTTNGGSAFMAWYLDNNAGNSGGTGPSNGHTSNANPGYAFLETSNGPGFDTLISPNVDLTSVVGAARVKFFYHSWGGQVGDLNFLVIGPTGVDSLWGVSGAQQTAAADPWDSVVIDLSAYVGQNIQLAWHGVNTAGCCSGDIAIDEVEVEGCIPPSVDMAADTILAPSIFTGCFTNSETIDVQISNQALTAIDFSVDTTIVTVVVTGAVTQTLIDTITSGTLAPVTAQTYTMSTPLDMTTAGTYNITAYVNVGGDTDTTNDTTANAVVYTAGPGAGSIAASPNVLCVSGTTDVSFTGLPGITVQYQEAAAATGPWTNVGTGGTMYTSGTLTSTAYYRAIFSCNGSSDTTNVDTVVVNNPMITSTMGDTICGADTAILMATGTGASLNWYDAPIAGTLLDTGGTFSPFVSATDTFYVAPLDGEGKVLITEVCQFNTAPGWANPGPPLPSSTLTDPIELTNVGSSPIDIGGWKIEVTGTGAGTLTFPAGNVIPAGGTFVIARGIISPATADIPGVFIDGTASLGNNATFSSAACGYILSDASGTIQDVTATNGYAVVGSGTPAATAADWTGTTGGSGSTAGIRRTVADDTNDGSDWTVAGPSNVVNYGDPNIAFTLAGCEGNRVAVIAVSTPATPITVSMDTMVCWDGSVSVPLTVSSTNTAYTYTWSPATGLDVTMGDSVNANPLTPTQYIVVGVDSTGCGNTDTVNIGVVDSFTTMATATPPYICGTDSSQLLAENVIPTYCASGASSSFDTKIDTVTFAGVSTGSAANATETYTDYTAVVIPVTVGTAYPLSVRNGSSSAFHYAAYLKVFIDYNQDGVFAPAEEVYAFGNTTGLNTIPATTVTIPATAVNGTTTMRLVLQEGGSAATDGCATFTFGETEDYTVDISGGIAPPAFNYTWMPGALMGDSLWVTPAATTTYTLSQVDGFGCTATDSVEVTVGAVSGILSQATAANAASMAGTQNQTIPQMDGTMVNYFDTACNLIVTVDDGAGGNILGNTVSTVTVEAAVQVHNGEPFVARWYQIIPTSNGPADVTLYFTQADFDAYNAHPAVTGGIHDSLPTGPADAAGIARLMVTKNDDAGLSNNPIELTPTSVTWVAADNRWEVLIATPSFSQFRAHALNPMNTPLPVTLTKFDVTKQGSVSFAAWLTESERNNSHFNLQRSLDGNVFTTLGTVNTKAVNGTSNTELSYNFSDVSPQIGHNYYRLEQVDRDGQMTYSRIVDVVWGADGSVVSIYPNPATDKLNVDVSIDKVAQLEVRLIDMSGRVIKSTVQQTVKGMNNVTFDLSGLAAGVYGVQIYENNQLTHTSKVNKQVN